MVYPINWSPRALDDLHGIVTYHQLQGVEGLEKVVIQPIIRGVEYLQYLPLSGLPRSNPIYRSLIIPPYRIEYRFSGEMVFIMAVWDTRRNPDDLPPV